MKNSNSTTAQLKLENEKIEKVFTKEFKFLKALIAFSIVQYILLLCAI